MTVGSAPTSNTGAENALGGIGVGWLSLTLWTASDRGVVLVKLGELLGELGEPLVMSVAPAFYTVGWRFGRGSVVALHDDRPGEVHIALCQSDCEVLGWFKLRRLVVWASRQSRWHATRLDLNYDDRALVVMPREVYVAASGPDAVTHVKPQNIYIIENAAGGATTYVGGTQSDEMLRVYRADIRHPDQFSAPATRWEIELRRERADQRVREFFGIGDVPKMPADQVVASFWGVVRRLIDFRDAASAVHVEDRKALGWWATLTGLPAKMKLAVAAVVPQVFERAARWAARQWPRSAALIVREVERSGHGGWDFLRGVVEQGERDLARREVRALGRPVPDVPDELVTVPWVPSKRGPGVLALPGLA